jgi:hypothetical protein
MSRKATTSTIEKRMKNKIESRRLVMKEEIRRLYGVGNRRGDAFHTSARLISFPKRYIEAVGLKKGDIFVYDFVN